MNKTRVQPSPLQTAQTVAALCTRLETSLTHLLLEAHDQAVPRAKITAALAQMFAPGRGPDAAAFGIHGLVLKAAEQGATAQMPALVELFLAIDATRNISVPFTVRAFSPQVLGTAECHVLQAAYADDSGLTADLIAPSDVEFERVQTLIHQALALTQRHAPSWAAEMAQMTSEIYLAVNKDPSMRGFGGASVFDAFGSILVNPVAQTSVAGMFMTLIHETSHSMLFLHHLDDPIVLDDGSDTYASPLRAAPRPMEGIFHAAWVSARMVGAAQDALAGGFPAPHAQELEEMMDTARTTFWDCVQTIDAHAKLTAMGVEILANAKEIARVI